MALPVNLEMPFANGQRSLVTFPQKRPLILLTTRPPQLETPFSVFNDSKRWIELLPPQIQMDGAERHGKQIKAEPVAIVDYAMTARRLAPGERADGVVVFERPAFKELGERLMLQLSEAERVDRPILLPLPFVAAREGERK